MRIAVFIVLTLSVAIAAAGCISKPYVMTMDRVDQQMSAGNRGYLKGAPPVGDRGDLKRPFIALDIDLPSTGGEETAAASEPAVKKEDAPVRSEAPVSVRKETRVEEEIK